MDSKGTQVTEVSSSTPRKSSMFQILLVFAVSYLCISCGTFLGYTSSAIVSIKNDEAFDVQLTDDDISWIGSLGPMGALCGSLLTSIAVRYFGIKGTMLYGSCPAFIISWLAISFSTSMSTIFIGRFAGGIGTGMAISSAPMYVISIVDIGKRGKLGVIPQFLMLSGILISYSIGALVKWNIHAFACLFITLPSVVFLFFAPQTPRWLILNGQSEDALALLEKLHGKVNGRLEYDRLLDSINPVASANDALQTESSTKSRMSQWFKQENVKPILLSLGLMSFQQLSGINGVTFYSVSIFQKSSGVGVWGPNLPTIILALVQCITSLSSTLLIDRIGRKILLLISALVTGLSSTAMGAYFFIIVNNSETQYDHLFWFPLVILVIFAFGFAIGFGPVPYLYVTEILPEEIRTIFNPIIIAYTWGCVFSVTKSFPFLASWIDLCGVFWVYASFSFLAFVFILLLLPETKGKSLEEVRQGFNKNYAKNATKINNNISQMSHQDNNNTSSDKGFEKV